MSVINDLKEEMKNRPAGVFSPELFRARGYAESVSGTDHGARADGIAALFGLPAPFIYKNDLIAGSIRDVFTDAAPEERQRAAKTVSEYPERGFGRNGDHFAADYFTAVDEGIPGLLLKIEKSKAAHS